MIPSFDDQMLRLDAYLAGLDDKKLQELYAEHRLAVMEFGNGLHQRCVDAKIRAELEKRAENLQKEWQKHMNARDRFFKSLERFAGVAASMASRLIWVGVQRCQLKWNQSLNQSLSLKSAS